MSRPRILIVDDERDIRWSLQQKLSGSGFDAREVETGEEALRVAEEAAPDLVLLDVRLPGIDGVEVLRRLRAADPAVIVVMLSAGDAVEQAIRCRDEGAFDYLVKPFDLTEVLAVVNRALEAGREARKGGVVAGEKPTVAPPERILGMSPRLKESVSAIREFAEAGADPVLIRGEPGTGKERFARVYHEAGGGTGRPFHVVRCASLPDHLCEYELFGHERGGISGEGRPRAGILEQAEGGTVYLDEIGQLRPAMQERLLGLIGTREFVRVGGTARIRLGARIVAGTAKDLEKGASAGWFLPGLRSAMTEHSVTLPPLRERREDVPLLAEHFAAAFAVRYGRPARSFDPQAMRRLVAWRWPGNVHELRTLLERLILSDVAGEIAAADLPMEIRTTATVARPERDRGEAEAKWAL